MIAGLIQVRKDSERFPKKALAPFGDMVVLSHIIHLTSKTKYFTPIVITTTRRIDDEIEAIAQEEKVLCFRGDYRNVAKRALDCIKKNNIYIFARINGDCPFLSAELIDKAFEKIIFEGYDFVSNVIERTYPYGISIEVFKADIFMNYYTAINNNKYYQEHLTSYFYNNCSKFNFFSEKLDKDFSDISLTIDYPEDIKILRKIWKDFPAIKIKDYPKIRNYLNS